VSHGLSRAPRQRTRGGHSPEHPVGCHRQAEGGEGRIVGIARRENTRRCAVNKELNTSRGIPCDPQGDDSGTTLGFCWHVSSDQTGDSHTTEYISGGRAKRIPWQATADGDSLSVRSQFASSEVRAIHLNGHAGSGRYPLIRGDPRMIGKASVLWAVHVDGDRATAVVPL
jgi:hypothetical protein